MASNYKVVPYEKEHGDQYIETGLNDKILDIDASFTENRIDFAIIGLSFTLLHNDIPICSGGIFPLWHGVGEGWVIASKRIFDHKIKSAKLIKRRTDLLCAVNKIKRLQTSVRANFPMGLRFAKFLGFNNEGLMKHYGPDGSDFYRMAKIYI